MTVETMIALGYGRTAAPGELCTCGRPAVVVFTTERGEAGWCGIEDGGAHQADTENREG